MADILLKDYHPRSLLVTEEHEVKTPRFPVIDAHNHLGQLTDAFGGILPGKTTEQYLPVEKMVEVMDQCSVKGVVNLNGFWGDLLKRQIDGFDARYPGRFCTFANVDWSRVNEPGFAEQAARDLEDAVRHGARGLKIFKSLGLTVRDAAGKLISPDDARLDPIWARAGELDIPVLIHVADDLPFFYPLDEYNEAYLMIQKNPEWHFYGGDYPGHRALQEAGIRLVARHPKTIFITAHVGWLSDNDLKFLTKNILDPYPNVYTDISACVHTLGRQPYSARKFFIDYQDRILFGTDWTPSLRGYRTYYRLLETADEYFDPHDGWPEQHRVYGFYLPDDVLEKVYHKNAERLIRGFVNS
jgi:uncharacterized protein